MVKHIAKIVLGDEMYYVKDTEARNALIDLSEKGIAGGVATLDNSGKIPSSQLPSYVDDVVEGYYNNVDNKFYNTFTPGEGGEPDVYSDEITGETSKIYVDKLSNQSYRWSGSTYILITSGGGSVYTLPIASANTLGGVKVGTNLSIDGNGVLSATDTTYSTMGASGSTHAGGLVPDTPSTAGTSKYLREDGTWAEPGGSQNTVSVVNVTEDLTDQTAPSSIVGVSNSGKSATVIYKNNGSSNYTISISTSSGYVTPYGRAIQLVCMDNGYCEVCYLNVDGTIFARGI